MVAASVAVVYWNVYFYVFGFLDDFPLLAAMADAGLLETVDTNSGRPLQGLMLALVLGPTESLEGLRFARLFGVIGLMLCAVLIFLWLQRRDFSRYFAGAAALVVVTTPPFQLMATWAVASPYPWAVALAGAGAYSAFRCAAGSRRHRATAALGAIGAVVAAYAIYQPAAFAFLAVVIVDLLLVRDTTRGAARRIAVASACFVVASVFVAAFSLLVGVQENGRVGGGLDLWDRLTWFVDEPLVNASSLWSLPASSAAAATVFLWIAGGLAVGFWDHRQRFIIPGLAAVIGLPLLYLPNLIAAESWAAYRTLPVLMGYMALLAFAAGHFYADFARRHRVLAGGVVTAVLVPVAIAAYAAVSAQHNVTSTMLEPQAREVTTLSSALAALPHDVHRVAFVTPAFDGNGSPFVVYDEFGITSSSVAWTLPPMVEAIRRRAGAPPIDVVFTECTTDPGPVDAVVDLQGLLAPAVYGQRECSVERP